jgi:zinc transport system permease protein
VGMVSIFYKEFLAVSFDEEFAHAAGVKVNMIYYLLLCLVALAVVLLVRLVGIVLVIALLTIPASLARMLTCSLKRMMVYATLIAIALSVGGLLLSYMLDVASGATIILLSGLVFSLASTVCFLRKR